MKTTPLVLSLLLCALSSQAQDPLSASQKAECTRLGQELEHHALGRQGSPANIAAAYGDYEKMLLGNCPLSYSQHEVGSQGAAAKGLPRARLRAVTGMAKACQAGPATDPCRTEEGQLLLGTLVAEIACHFVDSKLTRAPPQVAKTKRDDKGKVDEQGKPARTEILKYEMAGTVPMGLSSMAFKAAENAQAGLYDTGAYTEMIGEGIYTLDGAVIPVVVDKGEAIRKYKVTCVGP